MIITRVAQACGHEIEAEAQLSYCTVLTYSSSSPMGHEASMRSLRCIQSTTQTTYVVSNKVMGQIFL